MTQHHVWLIGPTRLAAEVIHTALLDEPTPTDDLLDAGVVVLDASAPHRADPAGTCAQFVRRVYPWLAEHDPAAVTRAATTIHLLAPDLLDPTLDADPQARPPLTEGEVLRLAHGLTELLHAWGSHGTGTVVFHRADQAGAVDLRLLESLTRRVPAELVRLVLTTPTPDLPTGLRAALDTHAVTVDLRPRPTASRPGPPSPAGHRRPGYPGLRRPRPPGRDPRP